MTVMQIEAPTPVDIAKFLGLDPGRVETQALIAVSQRYGLDPLLKHVVGIRSGGEIRPYITRDGLLAVAHGSGQLDGIELVDGPTRGDDGYWHATVRVYRKDWAHPVTYPGRYPVKAGREGEHKYGPEMAIKTAECMALRRAFPVGLAVLEEGPTWDTTTSVTTVGADDAAATPAQLKAMFARLGDLEIPRDQMREEIAGILGREVASSSDLTREEVSTVLDALQERRSQL